MVVSFTHLWQIAKQHIGVNGFKLGRTKDSYIERATTGRCIKTCYIRQHCFVH